MTDKKNNPVLQELIELKVKITNIDTRLTNVEHNLKRVEDRQWKLWFLILAPLITMLIKLFIG